jgi:endoglucanase
MKTSKIKRASTRTIALMLVCVLVGSLGLWLLASSSAATYSVPREVETATYGGNAASKANELASAGSAAVFGAPLPQPPTGTTPVAINGKLKVCGVQLCNQYNKPIQLRGMSTHGIQWYGWPDCVNNASVTALAGDWKADVLRVSLYVQEGGYETNPTGYTQMAQTIVDAAIAKGMYVLIDWHQLDPGDPNYNTARAKTYFTAMANRYKSTPNVFYEIANEPNGVNWATIKRYADQLVPHIRAIDATNPIIVGTPGWDTFGVSGQGPATDVYNNRVNDSNLLYTFHFYAASHGAEYRAKLDEASSRVPVFVTEWGTQQASGDGGNDFASSQQYIDLMARKKISWTSWNYSDDIRTGAAFTANTCPNGPFTGTSRLKSAGVWVRDKILNPADNFPTQ